MMEFQLLNLIGKILQKFYAQCFSFKIYGYHIATTVETLLCLATWCEILNSGRFQRKYRRQHSLVYPIHIRSITMMMMMTVGAVWRWATNTTPLCLNIREKLSLKFSYSTRKLHSKENQKFPERESKASGVLSPLTRKKEKKYFPMTSYISCAERNWQCVKGSFPQLPRNTFLRVQT